MFSKWRLRDLHSLRKGTTLGLGCKSGAHVWAPGPSLYRDETSPGAHPHAEPRAAAGQRVGSRSVSAVGQRRPPCVVSKRLLECGASARLLRPVLLTVLLCARLNLGKNPEFLDCSKERKT